MNKYNINLFEIDDNIRKSREPISICPLWQAKQKYQLQDDDKTKVNKQYASFKL